MSQWWQLDINETLRSLSGDLINGLSTIEAEERLKKYGSNELQAARRISP